MKITSVAVRKMVAGDGKVFDYADLDAHKTIDEEGNETINHLYAKTIYLGKNDETTNYVEVDEPAETAEE